MDRGPRLATEHRPTEEPLSLTDRGRSALLVPNDGAGRTHSIRPGPEEAPRVRLPAQRWSFRPTSPHCQPAAWTSAATEPRGRGDAEEPRQVCGHSILCHKATWKPGAVCLAALTTHSAFGEKETSTAHHPAARQGGGARGPREAPAPRPREAMPVPHVPAGLCPESPFLGFLSSPCREAPGRVSHELHLLTALSQGSLGAQPPLCPRRTPVVSDSGPTQLSYDLLSNDICSDPISK